MADTKISNLAAVTSLIGTDEFVLARSGDTKKIDAADLAISLGVGTDGWTADTATWTYASATTFTVSGDVTAQFSKGTRLKLTQTTVKYFVVAQSSHSAGTTTVTITGGTSYTFANAAVTLPYYSYAVNPQGYPDIFTYTPVLTATGTAASLGNGTITGVFSMIGKRVHVTILFIAGSSTSFGTTSFGATLPVTARTGVGAIAGAAHVLDSGTAEYDGSPVLLTASVIGARITKHDAGLQYVSNTTPMGWTTSDQLQIAAIYEVAV